MLGVAIVIFGVVGCISVFLWAYIKYLKSEKVYIISKKFNKKLDGLYEEKLELIRNEILSLGVDTDSE